MTRTQRIYIEGYDLGVLYAFEGTPLEVRRITALRDRLAVEGISEERFFLAESEMDPMQALAELLTLDGEIDGVSFWRGVGADVIDFPADERAQFALGFYRGVIQTADEV